jgi:hypothetical protein
MPTIITACILNELDINSIFDNPTYIPATLSKDEILQNDAYGQHSANLRSLQQSTLPIQPSSRPNAAWCVSYLLLSRFWQHNLNYELFSLPDLAIKIFWSAWQIETKILIVIRLWCFEADVNRWSTSKWHPANISI